MATTMSDSATAEGNLQMPTGLSVNSELSLVLYFRFVDSQKITRFAQQTQIHTLPHQGASQLSEF